MMAEGLRLLGLGMTMVFVFLALLVLLMHGSARFFRVFGHYFPEPALDTAGPPPPEPSRAGSDDGARVAAAIAAVHAHRRTRR